MGGSKKTAELSLLAKVDEQTIQRSIKNLRELQAAERGVSEAANRQEIAIDGVNDTTRQYINTVRQSYTAARQDIENRRRTIQGLDQEAAARREVADAAETQARSAARASQHGGDGADFGRVGRGVSSVAAVLPGGAGDAARGIADLLGVLDDVPVAIAEIKPALSGLTGSISSLAVAGGVGIAIAALVVALNQAAQKAAEAQKNLDAAIDADLERNQLILSATESEIKATLEKLQVDRDALALTIQQKEAEVEAAKATSAFANAILSLAEALGFGPEKKLDEYRERLKRAEESIAANTEALGSKEVKERSVAEATEKAAEETAKQATQTERSVRTTQESTRAEVQRTQVIQQQTLAANALSSVLASVNQKQRDFVAATRKAEQERAKALLEVNERYRDQAIDAARQFARDEAAAKRQGTLEAARLAADRDFAALADLRDQQAFDAQERRISAQEDAEDRAINKARDLADVQVRVIEAQMQAAQAQLEFARQAVAEYFKAKGLLGDPSRFSDAQTLRAYQSISGVASTSGVAGGIGIGAFGPAFGGRAPVFGNSGAGGSRVVNVNVSGNTVNDARAIADIAARKTYEALNAELN